MKRLVSFVLVALLCIPLASCGMRPAPDAAIPRRDEALQRGPYLALGTGQSIVVAWRTNEPGRPSVRIGPSPNQLDRTITADIHLRTTQHDQGSDPLHSAPPGTQQFEAHLTGLKPATTYYYAIYNGDRRIAGGSEDFRFTTSPSSGSRAPFSFWVVGDSGTGTPPQADVYHAMLDYVRRNQRPIDLYLHLGDMAYGQGTDKQFQNFFFEPYELTLRHVICWPTMGNHEGATSDGKTGVGPYYDAFVLPTRGEAGGLPSGTEAYYSFDYANVHFICLNSHDVDRRPDGAMARWLKADLEQTRADWIIAFWHHPPYTKGSHDSDKEEQLIEMRRHIMPILESAGVDAVFTGHSHTYERSMLMDGAYDTPTAAQNVILDDGDGDPASDGAYRKSKGLHPHQGTVQVVAGHGGAPMSRKGAMPVMKRVIVEHGSVIVSVEGDTLTGIMLSASGEQRDLFQIIKRGSVTPMRIANPKQLPR